MLLQPPISTSDAVINNAIADAAAARGRDNVTMSEQSLFIWATFGWCEF
jgi:hypothetical protein